MTYNEMSWENLKGFNNNGENWKLNFKNIILSWILKENPKDIIDIACCTGHYIRKLRQNKWNGKYTGVDITPKLIKQAKNQSPKETFFIQDARDLSDVDNKSFDMVLLLGVIMHIDDYKSAIKEAFRVSKNKVIIMAYASNTGSVYIRNKKGFMNRHFTKKCILKEIPKNAKLIRSKRTKKRWILMFEISK